MRSINPGRGAHDAAGRVAREAVSDFFRPHAATQSRMLATVNAAVILTGACLCVYNSFLPNVAPPQNPLVFQTIGFLVNLVSVSLPGRFDSDVEEMNNNTFPWPTLFAPAGFAFAIWGVIYLGEMIGMALLLFNAGGVADAIGPASRAWLCANIAQALWCLAFRPWALSKLWLSSVCLAATALSLYASQRAMVLNGPVQADGSSSFSGLAWALVVWPRSLHMGWVTAATLVNLNAWAGYSAVGAHAALTVAAGSLVGAFALADYYASQGLKCAASAVAWALFAVSKGEPVGGDAKALAGPKLDGLLTGAAATSALIVCDMLVRSWLGRAK